MARNMNVKLIYTLICVNIILMYVGTNCGHIRTSGHKHILTSGTARTKRQAGYVYDKPTVSFDLPAVPPIATTQAPTVDRMHMYYAYPVPASGAGDATAQNTGSASAGTDAASGYSYGGQNSGSSSTSTAVGSSASGYNYGTRNTASSTSSANAGSTGVGGYNYGVQNTQVASQNTAAVGSQAVVGSGSGGYGSGRPASSVGSVSTSAPKYLPPKTSAENTVVTSNQGSLATTITKPSESYIPPSVQVSSPQSGQTVAIAQSGANAATSADSASIPNPGYLQPSPAAQPRPRPVANVPTQQYLPPIESPGTVERPVTAPAATYLPPVF